MEFILKGTERLNIYLTKEDLEAQNFSTAELYKDCADIKNDFRHYLTLLNKKQALTPTARGSR